MPRFAPELASMICLVHRDHLARLLGYSGATSSFADFCARLRITCVPGRRGWYDPHLVRKRLDEAQGLQKPPQTASEALTHVERRRARRGAA